MVIDPNINFNMIRDIIYPFEDQRKIKSISLINYNLGMNYNNVTKFNNKFGFVYNGQVYQMKINPGLYDIQTLLNVIRNQFSFLYFSINKDNHVTINCYTSKIDLQLADDSIFGLLGFIKEPKHWQNQNTYTGNKPYNLEVKSTVAFSLAGINDNQIELRTNDDVVIDHMIKEYVHGNVLKRLNIKLNTHTGHTYDFLTPIKIVFKVNYVHK